MSRGDDEELAELEVEVEADFELIVTSGVDDLDPGPPEQWVSDPEEVMVEEVELRSLRGAVEALEADRREGPGAVSSG